MSIDRFLELPELEEESASGLRNVVDTTRGMMRALQLLQVDNTIDVVINHLAVQRIDANTFSDWSKERRGRLISTEQFMDFLDQRARALAGRPRPHCYQPQQAAPATQQAKDKKHGCLACSGTHNLVDCEKFKNADLKKRHRWIQSSEHCYTCLKNGHGLEECGGPNCSQCGGRHHPLLCLSTEGRLL